MKLIGPELFAHRDLNEVLENTFATFTRNACFDAILANGRVSHLALRRAMFEQLAKVKPVTLTGVSNGQRATTGEAADMVASCTVLYEGLPDLFYCWALAWPPLRPVFGVIHSDRIVLRAEGWNDAAYLVRPLFWSEIAAIERHLSAQRAAITRWQRANVARVRSIAEVVYDRLDRTALRRIMRTDDDPDERERKRIQLWHDLPFDQQ